MNCSIVVPVYNGAETIPLLIERLSHVLPGVAEKYETILVNDGSLDNSWDVIQQLAKKNKWVIGVALMRNYGQHNATLCGIRQAQHEVIVVMDDDLQNPPEEIKKLLDKLEEGYDVVYGVARQREQAWWKSLFSSLVKRSIAYMMGLRTVRDIGTFKAFRTHLREAFANYNSPDVLVDALLSWGTSRFASVAVEEAPREAGNTNYNFRKLVKIALLELTSYTTIPLRLASIIGFFFTLIGFATFVYVLAVYFIAGSIPGFPFLASIISLFSGAQLFALGIIGEYLARIFDRTAARPSYSIGGITEKNPK